MKQNYIKIFHIILLVAFFGLLGETALAASLSFVPPTSPITSGDEFTVEIHLDTQGQTINAAQADFNYSKSVSRVNDISKNKSIFTYWPTDPGYSDIVGVGSIAGGLPNPGFSGNNGLVGTILMEALHPGKLELSFRPSSKALLNDGSGTSAKMQLQSTQLYISAAPPGYIPKKITIVKDTTPPEPFTPIITRTPNAFADKYFAVFSTQDLGSGLDHFEVIESSGIGMPEPGATDLSWRVAESPYLLKHQEGSVTLFVKAIDKAGNTRIEKATLGSSPKPLNVNGIIILLAILVILICIAYVWFWHRERIRKHGETKKK